MIADSAAKSHLAAELAGDLRQVHRFRLNGIQDVHAGVDQVADDRGDIAATVEDDVHVAAVRFVAYTAVAGGERIAPHRRRDHHRSLRAPIVGHEHAVHAAEPPPRANNLNVVIGQHVEQTMNLVRIAVEVGNPRATRAVGTAVGHNPIAVLIPCHRVIRKVGGVGNYRYGAPRKLALLGWEASRTQS